MDALQKLMDDTDATAANTTTATTTTTAANDAAMPIVGGTAASLPPAPMPTPSTPAAPAKQSWLTEARKSDIWFWKEIVIALAWLVFIIIQIANRKKA